MATVEASDPDRSGPTRGCAACRARLPTRELIRFALDGDVVVVDLERRRPGRGLNLGTAAVCFARAVKRGSFARAFRRSVPNSQLEALRASVAAAFIDRLVHFATSSGRSGGVVAVQSPDEVEPAELKALLLATGGTVGATVLPQVRALTPRASAKIAWLARGVSEFTFDMAGGMKRRPESPEPCVLVRASAHPARKNE